jgi:hypothetical protein
MDFGTEMDSGGEPSEAARSHLPSLDNAALWLAQMAMLVPLALIITGAAAAYQTWSHGQPIENSSMQLIPLMSISVIAHQRTTA